MPASAFKSDLPATSRFTKRPRSNSHRLRFRICRKTTLASSHAASAPPLDASISSKLNTLAVQFTFSLPEYRAVWLSLCESFARSPCSSTDHRNAPHMKFSRHMETLTADMTNLRLAGRTQPLQILSTSGKQRSSAPAFRLLSLPREIRDLVYTFAVADVALISKARPESTSERPSPIHIFFASQRPERRMFLSRIDSSVCALLLTCRLVFSEALPLFLQHNQFYLRGVECPATLLKLHPVAYNNIVHLDLSFARCDMLHMRFIYHLRQVPHLPRLRKVRVQRWLRSSKLPTSIDFPTFEGSGCCGCDERGKVPARIAKPLWADLVQIDITFFSKGEAPAETPASCIICALMAKVAQTKVEVDEQDEPIHQFCIGLSVLRATTPARAQPTTHSPLHDPVLLPRLEDKQSLQRHHKKFGSHFPTPIELPRRPN